MARSHDPDRFLCALFAPPARRESLFLLIALNHELARAREVTSQPMLALIRLQWWREVVEGVRKSHEVATPLSTLLGTGLLDPAELLALIDARETETEEIATLADWRSYALAGAGGLALAAGRVLGAANQVGLRYLGAAYGVAGMLRSVPALAARGRCLLPVDVLAAHGQSAQSLARVPAATLQPPIATLAAVGQDFLAEARLHPVPRAARPAALPGVLARRDLRHPGETAPRGLGDRLAVLAAMATGRW